MSAYNHDGISLEAYLVRIIAALCRQNGGELRIKGELVDTVGEATALLKSWDSTKQELVLTVSLGSFGEVFRVVPEKQTGKQPIAISAPTNGQTVDPLDKLFTPAPSKDIPRSASILDDPERLNKIEQTLQKRRIARLFQEEMVARRATPQS
jgi:hypothetical protein